MATSDEPENFVYDEKLSVTVCNVKEGENASIKNYFGFLIRSERVIDTKHKYCSECLKQQKVVRYSLRTSSGNLISHLLVRHNITIHSQKVELNQRKISDMLCSKDSTIASIPHHDKRYLLARQLCLWFCRDLVSFSNANKDGMNDFFRWSKVIGFEESLPDQSTLAGTALNDIYCVVYEKAKTIIQSSLPNVLGTSFDFWSDNVRRLSYISYWINWIDTEFQMQKFCLKTAYFAHPHTGDEIAKAFQKVKEEFSLTDKIFRACTDNGSNVKSACNILGIDWASCLGHDICLLISTDLLKHKDMEPIRTLKKKMKKINKALMFRYDELRQIHDEEYNKTLYRVLSELENISDLLDTSEFLISEFDIEEEDVEMITRFCTDQVRSTTQFTAIKNSNATRWNSDLTMFHSFAKNIDVINNCLERSKQYDLILSDEELKTTKEMIKILEAFEKATDVFQGSEYPTLNMTMIFYIEIGDSLTQVSKDKSLSSLAKRAVKILLECLDSRFKVNDDMILTAFLDPSMQDLQVIKDYLNKYELDMPVLLHEKWIKYELSVDEVVLKNVNKREALQQAGSEAKRIRLELIQKHCSVNSSESRSPLESIRKEYSKYTSITDVVEDPLIWWRNNQIQFPFLSRISKVMLSFTATSALVERLFSKAGIILTKRKANLNPTTMQKILFIHENFHLIREHYNV